MRPPSLGYPGLSHPAPIGLFPAELLKGYVPIVGQPLHPAPVGTGSREWRSYHGKTPCVKQRGAAMHGPVAAVSV